MPAKDRRQPSDRVVLAAVASTLVVFAVGFFWAGVKHEQKASELHARLTAVDHAHELKAAKVLGCDFCVGKLMESLKGSN